MTTELVRALARAWPLDADGDADADRALWFLGCDLDSTSVRAASRVVGIVAGALGALAGALLRGVPGRTAAAALFAIGAAAVVVGPDLPRGLASARRTRALGAAPSLLTRVTLFVRLSPSVERAASLASGDDGPLARSLADHARRARGSPGTGFRSFAEAWEQWFPALERACALVAAAGREPADQRPETLDRARSIVLDATRDRLADFGAAIRGPITAVYAFGVLLPLSLVALLPAVRAAGVPAPLGLVVVAYDVALPFGLLAVCGWLLARRPVAFPPPSIDRTHPDVPDRRLAALLVGVTAGGLGWAVATQTLPAWTPPIAAVGSAVGTALITLTRPTERVRERIREVEAGLGDALTVVGRRVTRGEPVEAALATVDDDVDGPAVEFLCDAARRQRRLGIDLETALVGSSGSFSSVASARTRDAASLLALAARQGRPAGDALVATGEHLAELRAVEREARRSVEQVTRTLSNTAAVFGPLVGGATVALAGRMGAAGPLGSDVAVGGLGLAIGWYVLVLAALLTALSTGLTRGFDRSLVGYRVGIAVLAATATYLTAVAGTGLVV